MINIKFILLMCILIISCSEYKSNIESNIIGEIQVIEPIKSDSLFVGIYKLTRYKNLGTPLYSSSSKDKKFSFIVEPGMYAISAQTSTHKSCTEPILIPDIHERLEIIFKLYPKEGLEKSRIEVKGFELYNEFVNLSNEINNFDNKFEDIIDQIENANQVTLENVYKSQYDKLIEIENKFDPFFKQIFIEKHLRLLKDIHPVYYEARGKVKYNIDRNELFKDKRYEDYIKLNLALLEQLDVNSYLLTGRHRVYKNIFSVADCAHNSPELANKLNICEDFEKEFITNFVRKSPNINFCSRLLIDVAVNHIATRNNDKAQYYLDLLNDTFPHFWAGENKTIESILIEARKLAQNLSLKIGSKAPEFSVVSLDGKKITLSELKGKFVFIDFWGTWCGPCRNEIIHIIKLYNTISNEKLQVLGLASDDKKQLLEYIKKENIEYPNVIVNEDILTNYGVSSYPTTYLIDPNGLIVAKNLHGEKLVDLVLKNVQQHFD